MLEKIEKVISLSLSNCRFSLLLFPFPRLPPHLLPPSSLPHFSLSASPLLTPTSILINNQFFPFPPYVFLTFLPSTCVFPFLPLLPLSFLPSFPYYHLYTVMIYHPFSHSLFLICCYINAIFLSVSFPPFSFTLLP